MSSCLPWIKPPLIINAPMGGIATADLAIAVTRAGGFGQIGAVTDMAALLQGLEKVHESFTSNPIPDFDCNATGFLPIGVGFLCNFATLAQALETLQRSPKPPLVVWLFAAPDDPTPAEVYTRWAQGIRRAFSSSSTGAVPQIWIQTGGSVAYAVSVAQSMARPEVLVVQGSDAGGHGYERGASILSLVPEIIDTLAAEGQRAMSIVAAGGIVDGRTAAAAFALGATGVVLGTRFLAAHETKVPHPEFRNRILAARDGARSTVRAKVFDELKGANLWPGPYDGRALVSRSWQDMKAGNVAPEEIVRRNLEACKGDDAGYGLDSDRAAIWAGAGVGLVNKAQSAEEIVKEIRDGMIQVLGEVRSNM